ncbi:tRNA lysidine(34) synthetase TilS [Pseudoalteromonas sp. SS15]|uniref:tRNA lysidine(34) synthetase TilS n=1 Tax=Pseudoalteromonas sp. SS15 TaxID=3139393 RepID=UPI003BACEF98
MIQTTLFKQFKTALEPKLHLGSGLTVALSGGVDSVVLLHLCKTYLESLNSNQSISVEAIYVNHGLSENAQDWQKFCEQLCLLLTIPFKTKCVNVQPKARQSLEALARDARYQALDELAEQDNLILLGQHADDQLETFLLRLKRGSGLTGLSAMQDTVRLSSGRQCIRPLLNISREDIEAFARTFSLAHIEDESNQDDKFDRNFLRNQIIPPLKKRFNGFLKSTLRSIELLQQQQALIDEISQADLSRCKDKSDVPITLKLNELKQFSELRQSNVVRAWLNDLGIVMPSKAQMSQILTQSLESREDAQMQVQLSKGAIRRYRDKLYFDAQDATPNNVENIESTTLVLNDKTTLKCESGGLLRLPFEHERVSIRFGLLKSQIKPYKKVRSNTLKYWLKELKVPTWQRDNIPLVFYDDNLVQVVGHFVSADYISEGSGISWELT